MVDLSMRALPATAQKIFAPQMTFTCTLFDCEAAASDFLHMSTKTIRVLGWMSHISSSVQWPDHLVQHRIRPA